MSPRFDWKRCRAALAIASLAALLACHDGYGPIDTRLRILLALDDAFSPTHRAVTEAAATSWNLELGTSVYLADGPTAGEQIVTVTFSDPECFADDVGEFAGLTLGPYGDAIEICPTVEHEDPSYFLGLMQHEIGHVYRGKHVQDPRAVMSVPEEDQPLEPLTVFTDDDYATFGLGNPGFVEHDPCGVARTLVYDGGVVAVASDPRGSRVLVGHDDVLEEVTLDPATARSSQPRFVAPWASDRFTLHALTTSDSALLLTWREGDALHSARIEEDGTSTPYPPFEREGDALITSVIATSSGTRRIATREIDRHGTSLVELDASGHTVTATMSPIHGTLVSHRDEAILVGFVARGEGTELAAARVDEDLLVGPTRTLAPVDLPIAGFWNVPSVFTVGEELLVTVTTTTETLLIRVGPDLVVRRLQHHAEPFFLADVLEHDQELIVAAQRFDPMTYTSELYVAAFDRSLLSLSRPWHLVTTPDSFPGGDIALLEVDSKLVATWIEGLGRVRARCLAWP